MIPIRNSKYTQVLELAREVVNTSDIDFESLSIDEETSLQLNMRILKMYNAK